MPKQRSRINWSSVNLSVWFGTFTLSLVQFLIVYYLAAYDHNNTFDFVSERRRRREHHGGGVRYLSSASDPSSTRLPVNSLKSLPQSKYHHYLSASNQKKSFPEKKQPLRLGFEKRGYEQQQQQKQHIDNVNRPRKQQTEGQKTAKRPKLRVRNQGTPAAQKIAATKKKGKVLTGKLTKPNPFTEQSPLVDSNIMAPILKAGKMYSLGRLDRSGSVISDMLYAHAFAFAHNITYAGACHTVNGLPKKDTLHLLQGLRWTHILPFDCPEGVSQDLHIWHPNVTELSPLILPDDVYRFKINRSYFTADWREHIHNLMKEHSKDEIQDLVRPFEIVVHIRRGDVSPCNNIRRYLTNQHYLQLIDQYTPPAADRDNRPVHVTVYSESDSFESFDVFRERSYTVELDTKDLAVIWKALVTADLAILSRSYFSFVPAAVCSGTVVATQFFGFEPLDGWIEADDDLVQATDREIRRMAKSRCKVDTTTDI